MKQMASLVCGPGEVQSLYEHTYPVVIHLCSKTFFAVFLILLNGRFPYVGNINLDVALNSVFVIFHLDILNLFINKSMLISFNVSISMVCIYIAS